MDEVMERTAAPARGEGREYARGIWPAQPRQLAPIRVELRRWLAPLGMTGEAQEDLVLAVSEAAGNSVEHAYLGATASDTVELIFWTEPGAVCVQVLDHGQWRTPRKEPRERGRGILVMRGLMESVQIDYGPGGTRVLLRLAVHDRVLDRVR
jgi:serine/threonine-protein kinase RsbW